MHPEALSPAQALPQITAMLDQGRPCRLVVTGNSMQPLLRHGRDAVVLAPIRTEQVLARATHIHRGGRVLSLDAPLQRRRAALWQVLRPVRRYILAALRRCGRLK